MLVDIDQVLVVQVLVVGYVVESLQFNVEYVLVDCVQVVCNDGIVFILINFVVFIYILVVLCDVLVVVVVLFIEIYLFNLYICEFFCQYSFFSDKVVGVVCGFGVDSYCYVMDVVLLCVFVI